MGMVMMPHACLPGGMMAGDIIHMANPFTQHCTAAVLLEAVAEDIREYLRSRRDTIRCIVTMLTNDTAGANAEGDGESLFEELKRTVADEVCAWSAWYSVLHVTRLLTLMQLVAMTTGPS